MLCYVFYVYFIVFLTTNVLVHGRLGVMSIFLWKTCSQVRLIYSAIFQFQSYHHGAKIALLRAISGDNEELLTDEVAVAFAEAFNEDSDIQLNDDVAEDVRELNELAVGMVANAINDCEE